MIFKIMIELVYKNSKRNKKNKLMLSRLRLIQLVSNNVT